MLKKSSIFYLKFKLTFNISISNFCEDCHREYIEKVLVENESKLARLVACSRYFKFSLA